MALGGGSAGAERPAWLPPLWFRGAAPLVVAAGLWLGHRWAWGLGVGMCSMFILWAGFTSLVLVLGGYFGGGGGACGNVPLRFFFADRAAAPVSPLHPRAP